MENGPGLIKKGNAKFINEGKLIVTTNLIEERNFDFEEANERKVIVAQICVNVFSSERSINII